MKEFPQSWQLILTLVATTITLQIHALSAGQQGTILTREGDQIAGELVFAKDKIEIKDSAGKMQTIEIAKIRQATLSENQGAAIKEPEIELNGLRGRYYSNILHKDAPIERIDPVISFDWGEAAPAEGVTPNGFSVRWEGDVESPVSGEVTFEVESDDGCRLWVNEVKLIDHWQAQSATKHSGKVTLEAGKRYSIKLDYYDGWSTAMARLRWKAEGVPYDYIPSKNLHPLPLIGPTDPRSFHELKLKSGSALAGKILEADTKRVRIEIAGQTVSIPTPAVSYLRFAYTWGTDLPAQLANRPQGASLLNRDFAEGKFKEYSGGVLKLESVIFGNMTIQKTDLRGIKFADIKIRPAKMRLLTRHDTAIYADEVTSLPNGQLKIRDGSGYHIMIPANHIKQMRVVSPEKTTSE